MLGKNNENLGKIVAVIAKCLGKGKAGKDGLVDEATWQKMLILLQQMNSSLPPQVPCQNRAGCSRSAWVPLSLLSRHSPALATPRR